MVSEQKIQGINVDLYKKRVFRGLALTGVASAMVACGGGGGGGGGGISGGPEPVNEYEMTLTAAQPELPLNIAGEGPGIGVHAPYTTTVYVSAKRKNTGDVIPGGEEVFGCNVLPGGLEYGALYYLDGDPDHETEVDQPDGSTISIPNAYRSVTLGANAGGASFHFHAGAMAGTAQITCSVTDPQSNKQVSKTISIAVGLATGKASQVRVTAAAPEYLFAQNTNGPTQLLMQAQVLDDAGQRAPNPSANNLYAEVVSGSAEGVALRGAGTDGSTVKVRSVNGQAQFSLVSGAYTGVALVRVTADRADNNVDNGITLPVSNLVSVPVVAAVGQEALAISTETALPDAYQDLSYATVLTAQGGVPPYSWSRVTGSVLPPGLSLSTDGVITGTPRSGGVYRFALRAVDSSTFAQSAIREFSIAIAEPEPEVPVEEVIAAPAIATGSLPDGVINMPYLALAAASGGDGTNVWSAQGLPAGLSITPSGIISGTPTAGGEFDVALQVVSAGKTAIRVVRLSIGGASVDDVTPPQVAFTIPADRAVDVSPTANVTVVFNEAMDADSIVPQSFAVYRIDGFGGNPTQNAVGTTGTAPSTLPTSTDLLAEGDRRFTFGPIDYLNVRPAGVSLVPGQHYRVVMSASPRDLAGNQICNTAGQCGTAANPVEGGTASYVFEFRVGVQ